MRALLLAVASLAGQAVGKVSLEGSPVQKVIELLEANKVKVQRDLAAEEKEMEEYASFCDDESKEKTFAIRTATRKIGDLKAQIEDSENQISAFKDDIRAMGETIAEKEKQLDETEAVRDTQKADFVANEKELVTSLDELDSAINEVKKGSGEAMLQVHGSKKIRGHKGPDMKAALLVLGRIVDATWVNSVSRRKIQGLLQTAAGSGSGDAASEDESDELRLRGAPKPAAFESATGGIMKMLEEMKDKSEEALSDARSSETRQQHSFSMMSQSTTDAIAAANEKLAKTKSNMNAATEEAGEDKAELTETQKNKASDEEYLATLTFECNSARQEWDARQKDAAGEMAALDKAKEILAKRVKVFVQTGDRTAAKQPQLYDASPEPMRARTMVLEKLKALSSEYGSFQLMQLVSSASSDPMQKIRGLIADMIEKLLIEANEEATQKSFCDEETGKSKASQAEKNINLDKLKSRLDKDTTKKAELTQNIKDLEAEIAALDKGAAEATKLRQEAHQEYLVSSKDFKDAAQAVEEAITVLKEYYEGTDLLQTRSATSGTRAPSFGSKRGDAASSILSILDMCQEDFTKMYMELDQSEGEADAAYKKMLKETKVSRAAKAAELKGSESEVKALTVAIENNNEDFSMTSQELDAVMAYLNKLKPQCESKSMSYAEKKSRREAEIQGLKQALDIITGA